MTKKRIVQDTILYYVSTALNQAVPFLILPIMTVYLKPDDFGFINTFSAVLMIATSVFSGFYNAINKFFFTKSEEYKRLLMGNLYYFLFMMIFLFFLFSFGVMLLKGDFLLPGLYLLLIPLVILGQVSLEFQKTVLKISKRVMSFALLTFSDVALNVSLSLILIISFSWNWQGRVVAIMTSTVFLGGLVLLQMMREKKIRFKYQKDIMSEALKLALPLIPSGLCVMLVRRSGVLFIDSYYGKSEAGLFGVAMNLATAILFLAVPVINVWTPYVFERLSAQDGMDYKARFGRILGGLAFFGLTVTIIFTLCSKFILDLMTTEDFVGAGFHIPWLAFGFFFWAVAALLTPVLVHFNRQSMIALASILGAIINLLLTWILISEMGPRAASIAFFISNFFTFLLMIGFTRPHITWSLFPSGSFLKRA